MKYFVSADIHGHFDEWITALYDKQFDINNPDHKIILCGDIFDRGRQPKEIIDFILTHKDKIILIRGNHEELMSEMIERNSNNYADLRNGTAYTIVDLYPAKRKASLLPPGPNIAFISSPPYGFFCIF